MRNAGVEERLHGRPILNVKILQQNLPSMDKALDLINRFKPSLIEEVHAIEGGLASNDLEIVRFHTHRIRSGCLYLGIERVGLAATQLEELIEGGASRDGILPAWSVLEKTCRYFLSLDQAELASLISGMAEP